MKKLIRIIFLLLFVQLVVAQTCTESTDCSGTTEDGKDCVKNSEDNTCIEKETCSSTKQISEDNCKTLPVYDENKTEKKGFTCVYNSETPKCEEKQQTCPTGELKEGDDCSNYEASTDKVCKADGEKTCKEVELCTTVEGGEKTVLTDSDCDKYGVSKTNAKTHKCIKDPEKNECTEQYLCGSVPKESTQKNCSLYPVKNSETHTCVNNTKGEDLLCMEEEKQSNNTNSTVNGTQTLSEVVLTTNIAKEIESTIIATTIAKEIETTSLVKNETTSNTTENIITNQTSIPSTIQGSNTETSIVFLGCSEFQMATSYFTFSIHFIPLLNSLFSNTLTFPLNVIYNTYLRRLEEVNANCNLGESSESMVNYLCRVQAETANIKQIKFEPNFKFSQGNVKIAGTTPLATMSMNNLQNIDDKYSKLLASNPSIYILDNSSFYGYGSNKFNISGTISGEKPTSISLNKDLSLMMNLQNNENEEETTKEADCTVTGIKNDKYTLDCTAKEKNKYNLQSAMSIVDNDILLVNINNSDGKEDGAVLDPDTAGDVPNYRYSKKSGGIGAGAIVGIVLACVAVLVAVITAILCLKKNPNNVSNNDTSIINFKNIK